MWLEFLTKLLFQINSEKQQNIQFCSRISHLHATKCFKHNSVKLFATISKIVKPLILWTLPHSVIICKCFLVSVQYALAVTWTECWWSVGIPSEAKTIVYNKLMHVLLQHFKHSMSVIHLQFTNTEARAESIFPPEALTGLTLRLRARLRLHNFTECWTAVQRLKNSTERRQMGGERKRERRGSPFTLCIENCSVPQLLFCVCLLLQRERQREKNRARMNACGTHADWLFL